MLTRKAMQGGGSGTVMIVEDDARMWTCSVKFLREFGYAVVYAANGRELLRIIETAQEVMLLFTGTVMVEVTSRQLADLAMARFPDLQVLYIADATRNVVIYDDCPTSAPVGQIEGLHERRMAGSS